MAPSLELSVECLEERSVPAVFGLPWRDAWHLTLSLAPDGTPIAGQQSELFQSLQRRFPNASAWQYEIVRALQTWAVHANLSVGLIEDSGDRFGVAGRMQGDARFGDIRIGARQMAEDVYAVSVPPDPFFSGTLAGDVFLNSLVNHNRKRLFPTMLHEAGHVFGLEHNSDPRSAMYTHFNPRGKLGTADIQAIQALYGGRAPDHHEPNDNFATATRIDYSGVSPVYIGTTPLVVYGDRTTETDIDYFWVQPVAGYTGPVTIQLQTAGISFMPPRMKVYDRFLQPLGQAQSTSVFGDVITVSLPLVDPSQRYYIQVDSPAQDVFGIGRYALAVTFDDRMLVDPDLLPEVMRGPYDSLSAGDIAGLFADPLGVLFNNDFHTNDTFLTAQGLQSRAGYASDTRYDIVASLSDDRDVDIYRVVAAQPSPGQDQVLTVTIVEMPVNGVVPTATVHDAMGNTLSAEVLLNGNGTYTIQASNLRAGADYFVRVTAALPPARGVGNYSLVAEFGGVTANLQTLASASLSGSAAHDEDTLYVGQSQLSQFVLSAAASEVSTSARVRMDLFNRAGELVTSLVSRAGETVSGSSVLLTPGRYSVRYAIESPNAGDVPRLRYRLRGANLSDPVGPAREDPTMEPMYECQDEPGCYCYPDGTHSSHPYWYEPEKADP